MESNRHYLERLIQREQIEPADYRKAATALGLYPSLTRWTDFLNQLLLWLSASALGFSLLFFIAFNWTAMGRLGRFALVEAGLVITLVVYAWQKGRGPVAQASLFTGALVVGGLLALFGQTYQTGADPWQLFFTWSLMILPWSVLARLPALWLLVIGLWNLSAVLYYQTFSSLWWLEGSRGIFWALFWLNGLALATWEVTSHYLRWLDAGWPQRILATGLGISITSLAMIDITDTEHTATGLALLVYVLFLGGIYRVYRHLKPDLFMLAGTSLSLIVVIDFLVIYHIFGEEFLDGFLLLLSLITIGLSAGAVRWLIHVHKALHHEPSE